MLFETNQNPKRSRRGNIDPFLQRNSNPLELLNEFLINRKRFIIRNTGTYRDKYVKDLIINELDLYLDTLKRVINGNSSKITN